MHIDVLFNPSEIPIRDFTGKVAVLIDVLRATSTITMAFNNGCNRIIPVLTPQEALDVKERFRDDSLLLGGERGGLKIDGFDLGNSPREYIKEVVYSRDIVFTTTNGTRALKGINDASSILIGSFLNVSLISDWCVNSGQDVILVPSGRQGAFSLEDVVCAGMIVTKLRRIYNLKETDAALASAFLFSNFKDDLMSLFYTSEHGKYLREIGFEEDLKICCKLDICQVIPYVIDDGDELFYIIST